MIAMFLFDRYIRRPLTFKCLKIHMLDGYITTRLQKKHPRSCQMTGDVRIKLDGNLIPYRGIFLPSEFHRQGVVIRAGAETVDQDVVKRFHVREFAQEGDHV